MLDPVANVKEVDYFQTKTLPKLSNSSFLIPYSLFSTCKQYSKFFDNTIIAQVIFIKEFWHNYFV